MSQWALALLIASSVGCDQATKQLAIEHLKGQPPQSWGPARLIYAENPGAFLSLGGDWPDSIRQLFFLVLAGLAVVIGLIWLLRRPRPWAIILGGGLFVGGSLGNLLDRGLRDGGRVVDFAQIDLGFAATGIFNWADVLLMAAIPVFLIWGRNTELDLPEETQPNQKASSETRLKERTTL